MDVPGSLGGQIAASWKASRWGNMRPLIGPWRSYWYSASCSQESRAVGNAILVYKMHCTDMTDEEALRFLVEFVFQSEGEAILKIIRAKQSSCQLSTYFVGRMAFVHLRRRFQNELGEDFDLARFHEAALAHGTLPVKYLPELVARRLKMPR